MSILIKGIDMPKTPKTIVIYPNGTIVDGDRKGLRISKAEAVEIPTPHGRLIDADEMQDKAYKRYFNNTISSYGMFEVNRAIDNAPTILEGEDE